MFAKLETEFNAIVADVKSIPEKLESLLGFKTKVDSVNALAAPITTIIEDTTTTTEQKVEAILTAAGKL